MEGMTEKEVRDILLQGQRKDYRVISLSMSSARADEEILVDGQAVHIWTDGNASSISFKLNSKSADSIYVSRRNMVDLPFFALYITHSAQAGKSLDILVLRSPASVIATSAATNASIGGMGITLPPETIYTLSSDKDTHFAGSLATNAKEDENITGLVGDKIRIYGISLQADQPLHFWLLFWSKDSFDDTDLDADAFLGAIEVDLSLWGLRPGGAGQYYMSLEDVGLDYIDADATQELHVSLMNVDAASKNAGATGEVKVDVKYALRS